MASRRSHPHDTDLISALGIKLRLYARASCARCKRVRSLPPQGQRMPIGLDETLFVNSDPCKQCGTTRVRVDFELQMESDMGKSKGSAPKGGKGGSKGGKAGGKK